MMTSVWVEIWWVNVECVPQLDRQGALGMPINPLSPHDHFTSLKTDLISLQLWLLA